MHLRPICATLLGGVIAAHAPSARAWTAVPATYSLEYMTQYSSCDVDCNDNSSLNQTDDQMNMLDSKLQQKSATFTRNMFFANNDTWATDMVEDNAFSGEDNIVADAGEIFAVSMHGAAPNFGAGQTFASDFCHKGNANFSGTCAYDSDTSRFGERSGPNTSTGLGRLRWLILATCQSIHTSPDQQWGQSVQNGLDYIVGYRGNSADSFTTDEVPHDFANDAFVSNNFEFKATWFAAAEDFAVDDTASVFAAGTSASDAANRRDHHQNTWTRFTGGGFLAWSWHQG